MSASALGQAMRENLLTRLGWSGGLGLLIIIGFALIGLIGPWLAPHDPAAIDPAHSFAAPSWQHPLGTDNLGRCLLSRLLYGTRLSLGTAVVATLIITTIGVTIGAVSGYYGGWLDGLLMRLVDILLAFPA